MRKLQSELSRLVFLAKNTSETIFEGKPSATSITPG
jgi:hypothetical protein